MNPETKPKGKTAMARKSDMFRGKFLKAADLNGKPLTVTIEAAQTETLRNERGEEKKTVLYFRGVRQGLALNLTNWDSVADITNQGDTDDWPGYQVELYPTTTDLRGKTVDCIRIRAPAQRDLPTKSPPVAAPLPRNEMDDEIPF
jgi:hypothetical protein